MGAALYLIAAPAGPVEAAAPRMQSEGAAWCQLLNELKQSGIVTSLQTHEPCTPVEFLHAPVDVEPLDPINTYQAGLDLRLNTPGRWIIGGALVAFTAYLIIGNFVLGPRAARRAGRSYSMVPFVGSVTGVLAIAALPIGHKAWLYPMVLLLDFTIPMLVITLFMGVFRIGPARPPRKGS